jgi:hypothetical protein
MLALQAASAAPAPTPEEIIVTGNRLNRVEYGMSVNRMTGATKCRISYSSGDPAVDRHVCEIAKYCARTAKKTRAAIEQCTEARKQEFMRTYVPRRT